MRAAGPKADSRTRAHPERFPLRADGWALRDREYARSSQQVGPSLATGARLSVGGYRTSSALGSAERGSVTRTSTMVPTLSPRFTTSTSRPLITVTAFRLLVP